MNRGERAGGRVRNTQVAVLSDAGHYEQVFGIATQPTRRRGVVAGDDEGVRRAPGVSVRMVKARPHRRQSGEGASFGLWCHALFAEWLTNRHQQARILRMMARVHNLGPSAYRLIGIVHSGMHMKRVARSSATSGSTRQLRVARRFWNR